MLKERTPAVRTPSIRVLGIDPGTRHLGWGIVEQGSGRLTHVAHGVIDTVPDSPLADRLCVIDDALAEVIALHAPQVGAIEGLFFAKDAQSAAKLGHARGVALLRLRRAGLELFEYAPAKVKRAVVGRGAADKHQVAAIVTSLLCLTQVPRPDAADALAIAVTHLHVAKFEAALLRSLAPGLGSSPRVSSLKGSNPRGPTPAASSRRKWGAR
jgi:crossover junction endodeoxyribonuclease RuvC